MAEEGYPVHFVRYEDLVTDFKSELAQIYEFTFDMSSLENTLLKA